MTPYIVMASLHNSPKCILIWHDKGDLKELIYILVKEGYIRSKRELDNLFRNPLHCAKVRWNGEKLYHLAYLLYCLRRRKYIIVTIGKGYFTYAERYFTDFERKDLKQNTLKRMSSRVNKEKTRFAYVRKDIDKILKEI